MLQSATMQESVKVIGRWANAQGFVMKRVPAVPDDQSFWPGAAIAAGALLYDSRVHAGHILHELGHIALTPEQYRSDLSGDVAQSLDSVLDLAVDYDDEEFTKFGYLGDSAVIAWSYFVAQVAGVDSRLPFTEEIFREGPETHKRIEIGIGSTMGSPESCQLFYAGLLDSKGGDRLSRFLF